MSEIKNNSYLSILDRKFNEDGSEKHIVQAGARFHVLWWDSNGEHCSEPNCEINKRKET
jgi:hypothetical protein